MEIRRRRATAAPRAELSPRFARLAARVVVAAGRRGAPLPRADPRHVHEDATPAGRSPAPARRSPIAAAWSARGSPDLLLYLFGVLRVVVGRWRHRARRRRLSPRRAPRSCERSSVRARRRRLRAGAACRAPRSNRSASIGCLQRCRSGQAARSAMSIGQQPAQRRRLQRRDAAAARAVRRRLVAAVRHVVAARDGAHRRRHRDAGRAALRRRREEALDRQHRRCRHAAEREHAIEHLREDVGGARARLSSFPRSTAVPKSERVVQGEAAAALHRHAGFAAAAARAARRCAAGAGNGQRRNARVHVAPDRAQARRFRRQR